MRVRIEAYRAHAKAQWRTTALFVGGAFAILVGVLGVVAALLVLLEPVDPGDDPNTVVPSVVVGIALGVVPLIVGALLLWQGTRRRRKFARFRDLAGLAQSGGTISASDITRLMGITPLDANRLVLDAVALGLLDLPPEAPAVTMIDERPADPGASTFAAPPVSNTLPAIPGADSNRLVGSVLNGTYRVEGFLGAGGMGAVYAARHLRTGRRYALKTLLAEGATAADAIKRFEREATAASALGHPGIIAVHDFNRDPSGMRYLVMDLLEGETLERRVRRLGSLDWPESRRVALEIGAALVVAHGAGLLHRDLKPANVFLAISGGAERAVVLDFGLVKTLDPESATLTASGTTLGTPLYMAPEQARGEECDARTDVHGLGLIVFEMLVGQCPYYDHALPAVFARILTTPAPTPSAVAKHPLPAGVDRALARALAKSPEDRFADMSSFVEALRSVS